MKYGLEVRIAMVIICLLFGGCGGSLDVTQMPRDQSLEKFVSGLMEHAGLHFAIRVVIDPRKGVNAYSTEQEGRLYIGYSPQFFSSLTQAQVTAVLGHEVGHLIYRHVGQRPEYEHELASDEWSGWLLYRQGLSMEEAVSLWSDPAVMPRHPSVTHPASPFRVEAAKKGWGFAQAQDKGRSQRLFERIQTQQKEMAKQGAEIAALRSEKARLDAQVAEALNWKKWGMTALVVGGILALLSAMAFLWGRLARRTRQSAADTTVKVGCEPNETVHREHEGIGTASQSNYNSSRSTARRDRTSVHAGCRP